MISRRMIFNSSSMSFILGRLLVLVALGLFPQLLIAEVLLGNVVAVSDGDTVKVLGSENQLFSIRLMGIDAPEKSQSFGHRSKQFLSDLIYKKQVQVEWSKKDRYGRIVGKIRLMDGTDVCLAQLTSGMAWHYKKYQSEQNPKDRILYSDAEAKARVSGTGLWREQAPVPPWEWRKR
jgi:endonuclease YncB( thermonuclease family)